jgi:hypothetical protein
VRHRSTITNSLWPEQGYTVKRIRVDDQLRNRSGATPWKAAYGLYLIRGCKMALDESEACGHFVPFEPLSEDEFKALRVTRMNPWSARR